MSTNSLALCLTHIQPSVAALLLHDPLNLSLYGSERV